MIQPVAMLPPLREVRAAAIVAAVHAALIAAIWLAAIVVYAFVFVHTDELGWAAVDLVAIAGCLALVYVRRDLLGFGSLGKHKAVKLVAIVVWSLACVLIAQLAI